YLEKRDARYKAALDKAIGFVLESQYPMGGRAPGFPEPRESRHHAPADYPRYLTFNDGAADENIDFLLLCHQALGDPRAREAIARGMQAFLAPQPPMHKPGWAL